MGPIELKSRWPRKHDPHEIVLRCEAFQPVKVSLESKIFEVGR